MRSLLNVTLLLLAVAVSQPVLAAPPASPQTSASRAAAPAIPDYGGRDSGLLAPASPPPAASSAADAAGTAALNPLAQAGRALEALIVVLALVVGGLALLKRSGLLQSDRPSSAPAVSVSTASVPGRLFRLRAPQAPMAVPPNTPAGSGMMTLLGSQTLPNTPGAGLHVVSVAGRTLLLGATAQAVTVLTELDADWEADPDSAVPPSAFAEHLHHADPVAATTDRLQALLARSLGNGE